MWVVGCARYKEFWDDKALSKGGFVKIRDRSDGNRVSKVDSDLIAENPFQKAVDIFPYPPPFECDWHQWIFFTSDAF